MYLSEYCEVNYEEDYNVVFVKWKKFCCKDDYRKPLEYALEAIKKYKCNYVADTRNGFENIPEDTKWVTGYFMPKAVEYGCQCIYFIIDENNSLKEELEGQEKDCGGLIQFKYIYHMPEKIQRIIGAEPYEVDHVGMSDGDIRLFPDKVLKIRACSEEARNEAEAMRWLSGRLSVPKIIAHEREGGNSYLLMTKMTGRMACDESLMNDPEQLTELLASALKKLWAVDISECPLDWALNKKLQVAEYCVENGLVDMENVEPETFGENGFADPEELLEWLKENRAAEELVLSHGDFCLPNIFISDGGEISYIDLGRTGIADMWCDIALCYRSLKDNYGGKYASKTYPAYDPDLLFEKLGIAPDWEKIQYYILLDEIF